MQRQQRTRLAILVAVLLFLLPTAGCGEKARDAGPTKSPIDGPAAPDDEGEPGASCGGGGTS